jgi:epoxyqueuosine reductase
MREWCLRFVIVVAVDAQNDAASLWLEVREVAAAHGLHRLGVAPATVMARAREALQQRARAGLHDTMQFTYRNPERSTDPSYTVVNAQSIVVAAWPYLLDTPPVPVGEEEEVIPVARVARYAWTDHYEHLRVALRAVARHLKSAGHRAVVVADDNALVDREAAWLGGLGWFGKNANLLLPGAGSWFVLGNVITTAALPVSTPVADGCGSCTRCLDSCPTGAILAPGVVDARRCLAWLLQRPGVVPHEFRVALHDRLYGCDDCQEVCPPTVRLGPRQPGGVTGEIVQAWVPVLDLLAATDDEILARHGRWYLHGRDPRWLRRNALVVLGNVADGADPQVEATLRHHLEAGVDDVLRSHAVWAAARMGRRDLIDALVSPHGLETMVADELSRLDTVPVRTGVA